MSAVVTALADRIVSDKASGTFILTPSLAAQAHALGHQQPDSPAEAEGALPLPGERSTLPPEVPARPQGEGLGQVCTLLLRLEVQSFRKPHLHFVFGRAAPPGAEGAIPLPDVRSTLPTEALAWPQGTEGQRTLTWLF
jgi:hypothetical protein